MTRVLTTEEDGEILVGGGKKSLCSEPSAIGMEFAAACRQTNKKSPYVIYCSYRIVR